jgi:hypothetical protein
MILTKSSGDSIGVKDIVPYAYWGILFEHVNDPDRYLQLCIRTRHNARKHIMFNGRNQDYLTFFLIDKCMKKMFPSAHWYFGNNKAINVFFNKEDAFVILMMANVL